MKLNFRAKVLSGSDTAHASPNQRPKSQTSKPFVIFVMKFPSVAMWTSPTSIDGSKACWNWVKTRYAQARIAENPASAPGIRNTPNFLHDFCCIRDISQVSCSLGRIILRKQGFT
jgi:hypothetical protein